MPTTEMPVVSPHPLADMCSTWSPSPRAGFGSFPSPPSSPALAWSASSNSALANFEQLLRSHEIPFGQAERAEVDGSSEVRYARDWSYSCSRYCGPGYLMIGDAACFVDPILSGGIDFASRGGANAAMAALQSLADPSSEQQACRGL